MYNVYDVPLGFFLLRRFLDFRFLQSLSSLIVVITAQEMPMMRRRKILSASMLSALARIHLSSHTLPVDKVFYIFFSWRKITGIGIFFIHFFTLWLCLSTCPAHTFVAVASWNSDIFRPSNSKREESSPADSFPVIITVHCAFLRLFHSSYFSLIQIFFGVSSPSTRESREFFRWDAEFDDSSGGDDSKEFVFLLSIYKPPIYPNSICNWLLFAIHK